MPSPRETPSAEHVPSADRASAPGGARVRVREIAYRPREEQPPHFHEWSSVTLLIGGSLEEWSGSRREEAAALSVVVKPAGTVHADRIGPAGARTLQVAIAPRMWRDAVADGGVAPEWRWLHAGSAARPLLRLLRDHRSGNDEPEALEGRAHELLAEVDEEARDPAPPEPRGDPPVWLARAREELRDTFREAPLVRDLARSAGVHPVSLARAYRRHFGRSPSEELRRCRVRAAGRLLADAGLPLSAVAYRAGFADQSHMCRDFKRLTGLTPGGFRGLAHPG